ncbi:hypothetical protein PX554_09835 [Sphingomonas sp. H39-1-10]|uniref:hypothetical protein n=1 Tax=Sphingomonas TaxID=13687 RepID=UPI000B89D42F|nr:MULTISPECIES: hypothetical protein [Sphingomonas]MDF0488431.1 hypothetical protein [Sphingomonas pollutisoli]
MSENLVENSDRAYFHRRAEQELSQAQRAADPAAVRAHYHLAGYYLDLVYRPDIEDTPAKLTD